MNFLSCTILSFCIPFIHCGLYDKPLPNQQPGCRFYPGAMVFYEHHRYFVRDQEDKNWICHEPYAQKLKYCFFLYKMHSTSKNVQTDYYNVTRDEDTVEKECKLRTVTYFQPDVSLESVEGGKPCSTNVSLDVRMFRCPITKMDLRFIRDDRPGEISDFYLAEGRNEYTLAVLYDSKTTDNICVREVMKPARDFVRSHF